MQTYLSYLTCEFTINILIKLTTQRMTFLKSIIFYDKRVIVYATQTANTTFRYRDIMKHQCTYRQIYWLQLYPTSNLNTEMFGVECI